MPDANTTRYPPGGKVTAGKAREIGPIMWILGVLCLLNLMYSKPH